jgi:hypothetical protein
MVAVPNRENYPWINSELARLLYQGNTTQNIMQQGSHGVELYSERNVFDRLDQPLGHGVWR